MALDLPLYYLQETWDESPQNESRSFQPVNDLYNIQDNYPKTDQGGHLSRSLGSLVGHQVKILLHPNGKEASLFSLLQVEKHNIPFWDLAIWLINSTKDIYRNHKTHLTPQSKDGHIPVSVSGWCSHNGRVMHASQDRWAEGSFSITEDGFHSQSWQVPIQTHTDLHSSASYIWHHRDDNLITHEQGKAIKVQDSKVALLPMCRVGIMRLQRRPTLLAWLYSL